MGKIKRYNKISYESRRKLIELVCEDKLSCAMAGKRLGISTSTAKVIVKKFVENGDIFQKKEERLKRELLDQYKASQQIQTNCQSQPVVTSLDNIQPFIYCLPFHLPEMLPNIYFIQQ